jgi:hypothetical protein
MKDSTTVAAAFVVLVLATAGLFFQAWILGIILSWFSVSLTFWQNFLIILLANMITYNSGGSSK